MASRLFMERTAPEDRERRSRTASSPNRRQKEHSPEHRGSADSRTSDSSRRLQPLSQVPSGNSKNVETVQKDLLHVKSQLVLLKERAWAEQQALRHQCDEERLVQQRMQTDLQKAQMDADRLKREKEHLRIKLDQANRTVESISGQRTELGDVFESCRDGNGSPRLQKLVTTLEDRNQQISNLEGLVRQLTIGKTSFVERPSSALREAITLRREKAKLEKELQTVTKAHEQQESRFLELKEVIEAAEEHSTQVERRNHIAIAKNQELESKIQSWHIAVPASPNGTPAPLWDKEAEPTDLTNTVLVPKWHVTRDKMVVSLKQNAMQRNNQRLVGIAFDAWLEALDPNRPKQAAGQSAESERIQELMKDAKKKDEQIWSLQKLLEGRMRPTGPMWSKGPNAPAAQAGEVAPAIAAPQELSAILRRQTSDLTAPDSARLLKHKDETAKLLEEMENRASRIRDFRIARIQRRRDLASLGKILALWHCYTMMSNRISSFASAAARSTKKQTQVMSFDVWALTISPLMTAYKDLEKLQNKHTELSESMTDASATISSLQNEIDRSKKREEGLESNLEDVTAEKERLEATVQEKAVQHEHDMSDQKKKMQGELDESLTIFLARLEAKDKECAALRNELSASGGLQSAWSAERDQLKTEIADLNDVIQEKSDAFKRTVEENDELRAELDTTSEDSYKRQIALTHENEALKRDVTETTDKCQELQQTLLDNESQLTSSLEKLARSEKGREAALAIVKQFESDAAALKARLVESEMQTDEVTFEVARDVVSHGDQKQVTTSAEDAGGVMIVPQNEAMTTPALESQNPRDSSQSFATPHQEAEQTDAQTQDRLESGSVGAEVMVAGSTFTQATEPQTLDNTTEEAGNETRHATVPKEGAVPLVGGSSEPSQPPRPDDQPARADVHPDAVGDDQAVVVADQTNASSLTAPVMANSLEEVSEELRIKFAQMKVAAETSGRVAHEKSKALDSLVKKHDGTVETLKKTQVRLGNTKSTLASALKERDIEKQTRGELQERIAAAEEALEEYYEFEREANARLQEKTLQVEELTSQQQSAMEKISQVESKLNSTELTLATTTAKVTYLERDLDEAQGSLSQVTGHVSDLEMKTGDLDAKRAALELENTSLQTKVASIPEYLQQIETLSEDFERERTLNADISLKLADTETKWAELKVRFDETTSERDKVASEVLALQESSRNTTRHCRNDLEEQQALAEALRVKLTEYEAELSTLRSQLVVAQTLAASRDGMSASDLATEIRTLHEAVAQSKADLAEVEPFRIKYQEASQESLKKQAEIERRDDTINAMKVELSELQSSIQSYSAPLEVTKANAVRALAHSATRRTLRTYYGFCGKLSIPGTCGSPSLPRFCTEVWSHCPLVSLRLGIRRNGVSSLRRFHAAQLKSRTARSEKPEKREKQPGRSKSPVSKTPGLITAARVKPKKAKDAEVGFKNGDQAQNIPTFTPALPPLRGPQQPPELLPPKRQRSAYDSGTARSTVRTKSKSRVQDHSPEPKPTEHSLDELREMYLGLHRWPSKNKKPPAPARKNRAAVLKPIVDTTSTDVVTDTPEREAADLVADVLPALVNAAVSAFSHAREVHNRSAAGFVGPNVERSRVSSVPTRIPSPQRAHESGSSELLPDKDSSDSVRMALTTPLPDSDQGSTCTMTALETEVPTDLSVSSKAGKTSDVGSEDILIVEVPPMEASASSKAASSETSDEASVEIPHSVRSKSPADRLEQTSWDLPEEPVVLPPPVLLPQTVVPGCKEPIQLVVASVLSSLVVKITGYFPVSGLPSRPSSQGSLSVQSRTASRPQTPDTTSSRVKSQLSMPSSPASGSSPRALSQSEQPWPSTAQRRGRRSLSGRGMVSGPPQIDLERPRTSEGLSPSHQREVRLQTSERRRSSALSAALRTRTPTGSVTFDIDEPSFRAPAENPAQTLFEAERGSASDSRTRRTSGSRGSIGSITQSGISASRSRRPSGSRGSIGTASENLFESARIAAFSLDQVEVLLSAIELGDDEGVKELLDNIEPRTWSEISGNVLIAATLSGNDMTVSTILARGVEFDSADSDGFTALHHVACTDDDDGLAIAKVLIDGGSSTTTMTKQGETALHLAVVHDCANMVEYLLERGCDPNATTANGDSTLHIASRVGNERIARCLLDTGLDPKVVNRAGRTSQDVATRTGHLGLAKMLAQASA